ncbi:winged helix-turn-helix domain-containing protein [Arcticibacter sp. MXS-1]|uniref:winged helix-turn-helix domain-containing protein n=1 Tax=Arcticibacter sp. MXS-1 TaxID=3341726 RepID=UPI0035A948DB
MEISQASYSKNLPYYQQIYDYFKRQIHYGKLLPNQKLPPESQLKDQFKVCRSTIHKALEHSKTMGLLYSIPRKGYYVASGVPPVILASLAKPDYPFVRLVSLKPRIPSNTFHPFYRLDVEIPFESEVLRTRFEKAFAGGCHPLLKVEPAAVYMRKLKSMVLSSLKYLHGLKISSSQLTLVPGEYDAYRNVLALLTRGEGGISSCEAPVTNTFKK